MSPRHHVPPGYTPYILVALVASSCQILANENSSHTTPSLESRLTTQTTSTKALDMMTQESVTAEKEPSTSTTELRSTETTKETSRNNFEEPSSSTMEQSTKFKSTIEQPSTNNTEQPSSSTMEQSTTITSTTEQSTYTTEQTYASSSPSTTEIPVPDTPTGLRSIPLNSSAILLEWNTVSNADGYIIQWQVNNETSDIENRTVGEDQTDIIIGNLQPWTTYNFSVFATRKNGVSEPAKTTDRTFPGAPCSPKYITADENDDIHIMVRWGRPTCNNGALDGYIVSWRKKEDYGSEVNITRSKDTISYAIRGYETWTEYTILVYAFNRYLGKQFTSSPATITIRTKPSAPGSPTNLSVNYTETEMHATWSPPNQTNGDISGYNVSLTEGQSDPPNREWKTVNETEYSNTSLLAATNYSFSVYAFIEWEGTTFTGEVNSVNFTTHVGFPSEPTDLGCVELGSNEIVISWEEPKRTSGKITHYNVSYCEIGQQFCPEITSLFSRSNLTGLKPCTDYEIKVSASTSKGQGSWSSPTTCRTKATAPGPPTNLTVNYTETEMHATWRPPNPTNCIISGYKVSVTEGHCQFDRPNGEWKTVNETEYSNSSLFAATNYSFSVCAFIECNGSTFTGEVKCMNFTTPDGIPSEPTDLKCLEHGSNEIVVSWQEPKLTSGKITHYSVSYCDVLLDLCRIITTRFRRSNITGLKPYTDYLIKVSASTSKRQGNWSSPTTCKTKAAVPTKPRLVVKEIQPRAITIEWEASTPYPGPTGYIWSLSNQGTPCGVTHGKRFLSGSTTNLKVKIDGLEPNTKYHIIVFARTETGDSPHVLKQVTTMPTVPEKIRNLKSFCSSYNAVALSWLPPGKPNGKMKAYHIEYEGNKGDRTDKSNSPILVPVTNSCNQRVIIHSVNELHPEYTYTFSVTAEVQDIKDHSQPVSVTCTLPAGLPPPAQKNISVIESLKEEIKFAIQNETFLETQGEIVEYAVVVAEANNIGPNESKIHDTEKLRYWSDFKVNGSVKYRATPSNWNPFSGETDDPLKCKVEDYGVTCVLGCEVGCDADRYCNGPLTPGMSYGIKLRGYTRAGFAETFPVVANTRSESLSSASNALIAVLVTAIFLLVLLTAAVLYYRCGGGRASGFILTLSSSRLLKSTIFSRTAPSPNDGVGTTRDIECTRPVKLSQFSKHVNDMMSDSRLKFSMEFEELKQLSPSHPSDAAQLQDNRPKNRWVNILPFDHSRVKLLPVDDEPASDYINASYIPGFTCHREYIASQGPLPGTIDDMWRMIWEQGVNTIVMLTQCVERGKTKCQQYWPEEKQCASYGDLVVQTTCQSILSEYTIRTFDLSLGNRHRIINQMHFTKWPDFGCPENTELLINFVRAVRGHVAEADASPLLIHCSAGVGRTGTFVAVDRLMQNIVIHDYVDIFHTVLEMRDHRTNMVQTEDQYVYIHECVRDMVQDKLARDRDSLKEGEGDHIYGNICSRQATTNV